MFGRVVMSNAGVAVTGNNQVVVNTSDYAKGVYIITLERSNDVQTLRLVIQ